MAKQRRKPGNAIAANRAIGYRDSDSVLRKSVPLLKWARILEACCSGFLDVARSQRRRFGCLRNNPFQKILQVTGEIKVATNFS